MSWRPADPTKVIPHLLHGPPQRVAKVMTKQMSVQSVLVSLLCAQGGKHKVGAAPTRRESASSRPVVPTRPPTAEPSILLFAGGANSVGSRAERDTSTSTGLKRRGSYLSQG